MTFLGLDCSSAMCSKFLKICRKIEQDLNYQKKIILTTELNLGFIPNFPYLWTSVLWILLSSCMCPSAISLLSEFTPEFMQNFFIVSRTKRQLLEFINEKHQINLCHFRLHVVHVTSKIISDSNRSHKNQLTFIYKMKCIYLPLDFN